MSSVHNKIKVVSTFNVDGEIGIEEIKFEGKLLRVNISSDSGTLRSASVKGRCGLPEIGKPFVIFAETFDSSLDKDSSFRIVNTSIVNKVVNNEDGSISFWTMNSEYHLTLKPEV